MGSKKERTLEFKDGNSIKTALGIFGLAVISGVAGITAYRLSVGNGVSAELANIIAMGIDGTTFMASVYFSMLRKKPRTQ